MRFSKRRHHSDASYRRDKIRLGRLLARWFGVHVVEVDQQPFRVLAAHGDMNESPFEPDRLGIYVHQHIIVATADAPLSGFTHEAGHLVACPRHVFDSNELDWLGWELQVARRARIPIGEWARENRNYLLQFELKGEWLDEVSDVVDKASNRWRPFSSEIIELSKKSGCVDANGVPLIHPKKRRKKWMTRAQAVAFVQNKLIKAKRLA